MPREDRMARSGDVLNRFSRTVLVAERSDKMALYKLKLRKNGTFVFRENFLGVNASYYCGRYYLEGNVLLLEFAEGRQPADVDRVMLVTAKNGMPYFKGTNNGMYIKTTNDLNEAVRSIKEELGFTPPTHNILHPVNSGLAFQCDEATIRF
ncbi:hypothetical protein OGH69_13480 [Flavobacterium sp. MFBS3-15]|uniref:hypothetical protein n=1 Tax=Flavobacterium sp. MFBS3-15 TaxID=2989816 RepID=UPI0022364191|nr:hypothetical protein [Flavobacterium sp. MFBS3-15]MCW4469984.1 hypothetical protein [Flavobacterium sp. MFBS3-15]